MLDRTINDDKTTAGGIGTMLAGRYHFLRQLGRGVMGVAYHNSNLPRRSE